MPVVLEFSGTELAAVRKQFNDLVTMFERLAKRADRARGGPDIGAALLL